MTALHPPALVHLVLLAALAAPALASNEMTDTRPGIAPDIREDQAPLKFQDGDFVAVPIPLSNPTVGSGLVAGAAYFYPQTEEQKASQPASLTGLAGMYTSNDSSAIALVQQNYWRDDRWRFTGALGFADVRLALRPPEVEEFENTPSTADWRVQGGFLFARLSRRLAGNWYGGGLLRVVDTDQSIEFSIEDPEDFDLDDAVRAAGIGLALEYDSRDMPTNPYRGVYFKGELLANDEALGSERDYQSLQLTLKSYHQLRERLVLAWEMRGCALEGSAPLWDACRIPLRGFPAFDYLGTASLSGQAELRARLTKRWGATMFAGSGWAGNSLSTAGESEQVPSYGFGVRFEVLPAKRINMRVDFAKSEEDEAVYLSVGEAF